MELYKVQENQIANNDKEKVFHNFLCSVSRKE